MNIECHCKNISLTVDSLPDQLTSCNCSICRRYNALWGYYKPDQVSVEIGESGKSSYLWNDKCIEFIHCKQCGCVTHYQTLQGDPSPRTGVNFCMADAEDLKEIPLCYFDGAKM